MGGVSASCLPDTVANLLPNSLSYHLAKHFSSIAASRQDARRKCVGSTRPDHHLSTGMMISAENPSILDTASASAILSCTRPYKISYRIIGPV